MSKKDEVFALLDQNYALDGQAVAEVGLSPSSLKSYGTMWQNERGLPLPGTPPELIPKPVPKPVPKPEELDPRMLANLSVAAMFLKDGKRYRIATKDPETIICHLLKLYHSGTAMGGTSWAFDKVVSMSPNTIVEPVSDEVPVDERVERRII